MQRTICLQSYDLSEFVEIKTYSKSVATHSLQLPCAVPAQPRPVPRSRLHSRFVADTRLFILQQTGEFEVFKLNKINKLYCRRNQDVNEHELKIISLDVNEQKRIIMTASEDNKIKIWSYQKILLCQINVFENLDCAIFGNIMGDLVIAHSGKLSFLKEEIVEIDYSELGKLIAAYRKSKPPVSLLDQMYVKTAKDIFFQAQKKIKSSIKNFKNVKFSAQLSAMEDTQKSKPADEGPGKQKDDLNKTQLNMSYALNAPQKGQPSTILKKGELFQNKSFILSGEHNTSSIENAEKPGHMKPQSKQRNRLIYKKLKQPLQPKPTQEPAETRKTLQKQG